MWRGRQRPEKLCIPWRVAHVAFCASQGRTERFMNWAAATHWLSGKVQFNPNLTPHTESSSEKVRLPCEKQLYNAGFSDTGHNMDEP